MFHLENTFYDTIEKIEKENRLEELFKIENTKELYAFLHENGYYKSEKEFKAEIEKLVEETAIDLENSELSKVAGGRLKNSLTKLTSTGIASLMMLGASPTGSQVDAGSFTNTPVKNQTQDSLATLASNKNSVSAKNSTKTKKIFLATLGVGGVGTIGLGGLGIYLLCKNHPKGISKKFQNHPDQPDAEQQENKLGPDTNLKINKELREKKELQIYSDQPDVEQQEDKLRTDTTLKINEELREKAKKLKQNIHNLTMKLYKISISSLDSTFLAHRDRAISDSQTLWFQLLSSNFEENKSKFNLIENEFKCLEIKYEIILMYSQINSLDSSIINSNPPMQERKSEFISSASNFLSFNYYSETTKSNFENLKSKYTSLMEDYPEAVDKKNKEREAAKAAEDRARQQRPGEIKKIVEQMEDLLKQAELLESQNLITSAKLKEFKTHYKQYRRDAEMALENPLTCTENQMEDIKKDLECIQEKFNQLQQET